MLVKNKESDRITFNKEPIISVVIPAFDAEKHIEKVVKGIPSYVKHIIIVDDCSRDKTAQVVEQLEFSNPRIRLIKHRLNQGVGGAMLSGYELAYKLNSDVVVKMDSDDQMDPRYIQLLTEPIINKEADYTKGNRFLNTLRLNSMPFSRRLGNLGLSFMTKVASGYWNIFDPTNGFTAIHGSIIPLFNKNNIDKKFFFETSILLQLNLLRAVVMDVPIPARYGNEVSNLSRLKSLFEFPPRLIKGLIFRLWFEYIIRDFGLFSVFSLSGIFLLVFGLIFGVYHWFESSLAHIATPTGTVMIAVLPIILGVQFLLQAILLDVQNVPANPLQNNQNKYSLDDNYVPSLIY